MLFSRFWSIFANFSPILLSKNHILKKTGRGKLIYRFLNWKLKISVILELPVPTVTDGGGASASLEMRRAAWYWPEMALGVKFVLYTY
jgi:hypothetical protein